MEPEGEPSAKGKEIVASGAGPDARERLRLVAWWFDRMKRIELGAEAYHNYVFKS